MVSGKSRAEQVGQDKCRAALRVESDMWSVAAWLSGHVWPPQKKVRDEEKNERISLLDCGADLISLLAVAHKVTVTKPGTTRGLTVSLSRAVPQQGRATLVHCHMHTSLPFYRVAVMTSLVLLA